MRTLLLKITSEVGLHARPASLFVKCAKASQSVIKVRNATKAGSWVDAKSILGVLKIAVQRDQFIELVFDGPDEENAAIAMRNLVESDFVLP